MGKAVIDTDAHLEMVTAKCIHSIIKCSINLFHVTGLFLHPMKISETHSFLIFTAGGKRDQWTQFSKPSGIFSNVVVTKTFSVVEATKQNKTDCISMVNQIPSKAVNKRPTTLHFTSEDYPSYLRYTFHLYRIYDHTRVINFVVVKFTMSCGVFIGHLENLQ